LCLDGYPRRSKRRVCPAAHKQLACRSFFMALLRRYICAERSLSVFGCYRVEYASSLSQKTCISCVKLHGLSFPNPNDRIIMKNLDFAIHRLRR